MQEKRLFHPGIVRDDGGKAELIGQECAKCGAHFFPPRDFCPHCLSDELREYPFGPYGELYAATITRAPLEHFDPPHAHGIVRFPEAQVSAVSPIDDENGMPQPGDAVEMFMAPLWTDDQGEVWGYKCRKRTVEK